MRGEISIFDWHGFNAVLVDPHLPSNSWYQSAHKSYGLSYNLIKTSPTAPWWPDFNVLTEISGDWKSFFRAMKMKNLKNPETGVRTDNRIPDQSNHFMDAKRPLKIFNIPQKFKNRKPYERKGSRSEARKPNNLIEIKKHSI